MARASEEITIEGRRLHVSNLGKIMYPRVGFTKAQVIDYYVRISGALLPHLRARPLTLKRYPNGVEGEFFYEKRCPGHRPPWVHTVPVLSERTGDYIHFCLVDDLPTLVWAINLADIEMHTYLHTARDVERPTMLVFDLDPGAPADIVQCCQVGLWIKELLDVLGLESFPKTSGSKGLQVYVPLNTPATYDDTKPFAKRVAQLLEREHPEQVVHKMLKALRVGKVLVDWSQNDDKKTTVCVYSLRAKERPTVSTPVTWDEVRECLEARDPQRLVFQSQQVIERYERLGDLFEPVLKLKQRLPPLRQLPDPAMG